MSLLLSFAFLACGPADDGSALDRLDAEYVRIQNALAIAERDTTRNVLNKEARERKIRNEQQRVAFFRNPVNLERIEAARGSADPAVATKAEAYWRHAVYLRSWTDAEKARETELLASVEALRNEVVSWSSADGEWEVELDGRWIRVSEDAETLTPELRAEVAEAYVEARTSWMGEELVQLIHLRNEVARREGFPSYWELALYHRGLDPEAVGAMADEIEQLVTPLHEAAAEPIRAAAADGGMDWTFANDPLLRRRAGLVTDAGQLDNWFDADIAEERVTRTFADVGLPVDGVQIYKGPSRYTRPGAFSYPLRPPEHVALVLSQDTRWTMWPYLALTHELGLATWWRNLPAAAAASPVLWQPATPWFEGYAQFFEHMVAEPEWLSRYLPDLPAEHHAALERSRTQETLEILTRYLGCTRFEQALYQNPDDLKALTTMAAGMEQKLRARPWSVPAAESGLAWSNFIESGLMLAFPAYVQNYLFAYATEATLWKAASGAVGHPVANPKVGPWLVDNLVVPVSNGASFPARLSELSGGAGRTEALSGWLNAGE